MINIARNREYRRLEIQAELDAAKDQAERNRMGQFATPTELAVEILRYAKRELDGETIRFIDPAIGTGSFYSALLNVFPADRLKGAVGYEVDPHYGEPAVALWRDTGLDVRMEDFTQAAPAEVADGFNLLICNPPYVRHHHIGGDDKHRMKALTREACGIDMNGLAGLYCYFLGLSHRWMADGGLAGWLVPSEFMGVNYGEPIKRYLLDRVTLLHIHRFDPNEVQFGDALVSSSVVWFMNGLAGLYCYFLGLSHRWMADGGLAGWLVPSEFMGVNYGEPIKRYLLDRVTLLHIHRFDPNEVQFGDALVSSSVVWFTNKKPPNGHRVRMTYGGSLLRPRLERLVPAETLRHEPVKGGVILGHGAEQKCTV